MVDRSRKMVRKVVTSIDIRYDTLGDALKTIQRLIDTYGPDATIDMYSYPYEDSESLHVFAMQPETDKEMAQRIAQEEQWAKRQEEQDLKEFERLKKKFESK